MKKIEKDERWLKDNLETIVKSSNSVKECLTKLGLPNYGDRYTFFKGKINQYKIDISHFTPTNKLKSESIKYSKSLRPKFKVEEIFCKNPNHNMTGNTMKRHLEKLGWNINKCLICNLEKDKWVSGKISMILDHIDGDHENHELTNLRIICPNCDSTLPTYKSRNINRQKK